MPHLTSTRHNMSRLTKCPISVLTSPPLSDLASVYMICLEMSEQPIKLHPTNCLQTVCESNVSIVVNIYNENLLDLHHLFNISSI